MSFPARSHRVVFAAGIAEGAAFPPRARRFDGANHDKMRHDTLCLDKTAVERGGRASEHRSAGYELGPFAARESFVKKVTATAGENIRERLVRGGKGVDAKYAVRDHPCRRRRGFVDAKQHHRGFVRDRGDGGRGNSGKSRRPIGRDGLTSGRDTAQRVAKPRRIEALTWHGAYFHASVLGFGHVLAGVLLYRNYLYVKGRRAMTRFPDSKHGPIKKYLPAARTPSHSHSSRRLLIAMESAYPKLARPGKLCNSQAEKS